MILCAQAFRKGRAFHPKTEKKKYFLVEKSKPRHLCSILSPRVLWERGVPGEHKVVFWDWVCYGIV